MKKLAAVSVCVALAGWNVSALQAAYAAALESDPVTIVLNAVNGSTASGAAQLHAADDQTEIGIDLQSAPAGTELSVLLVAGTCEAPGEVRATLGSVQVADDGTSQGALRVAHTLSDLLTSAASVQVHAAGAEATEALLCGDIVAAAVETDDDA
jgi:hypothetical protein